MMKKHNKTVNTCFFILLAIALLCTISFLSCSGQPDYWPTTDWKTSTPEAQGMDSEKLITALEKIEMLELDLHSLLVIRNGYIVLETYFYPYTQETTHHIYSCTKSFTSTLVGLAVDKGYIKDVNQSIVSFFPDILSANPDEAKKNITVRNLLAMRSGLDWPEWTAAYGDSGNPCTGMESSTEWVTYILNKDVIHSPGATFNYSSGDSHLLAVIVALAAKQDAEQFARKYLFNPLGIKDFYWVPDPEAMRIGGWGLFLRPRDMAKLGYLFLHKGRWDEKQIVSSEWIEQATHSETGWQPTTTNITSGYGYQWWLQQDDMYSAQGYGGQLIFVIPKKNMIVVTTGSLDYTSAASMIYTNIVESTIIPAVKADGPLAENNASYATLQEMVQRIGHAEKKQPFIPELINSYIGKTFVLKENPLGIKYVRFAELSQDELKITITNHNIKDGDDIAFEYAVGLDNHYRVNRPPINYYYNTYCSDTFEVLCRGEFDKDNSFSVCFNTLRTAEILQQVWKIIKNKITINIYDPAGGNVFSMRGTLLE
jgi:CubicO group peptidase (beta-lactamase class C family)